MNENNIVYLKLHIMNFALTCNRKLQLLLRFVNSIILGNIETKLMNSLNRCESIVRDIQEKKQVYCYCHKCGKQLKYGDLLKGNTGWSFGINDFCTAHTSK